MSSKLLVIVAFLFCGIQNINCAVCHVGWIQFQNKCYWFSHDSRPWGEAESICLGYHSKLAEPRNVGESGFLISHSQQVGGVYWIGISDMIEEDRWIYSSDQEVIQVRNFQPGEPNQHTAANCVAMWHDFHGKWADEPCGNTYRFVCEVDSDEDIDVVG